IRLANVPEFLQDDEQVIHVIVIIMCRLLGFKSSIPSLIHHSLHDAENAMIIQSKKHFDGWGVGFYQKGECFVVKRAHAAFEDFNFPQLTKTLISDTVVCHIRQATIGAKKNRQNCHPFQCGKWLFAHNGTVKNFNGVKKKILEEIPKILQKHILGNTDSEHVFYLFIHYLKSLVKRHKINELRDVEIAKFALVKTIQKIDEWSTTKRSKTRSTLNFVLTNGYIMLATRRGKSLFHTESSIAIGIQKSKKPAHMRNEIDKYFLVSSEKLSESDYWERVPENSLITVTPDLKFDIVPL
ncbi:MAG: class II glutamine amidotransferase, partial [Deltaproteobacteria bacterium]|nr:class II glutamine amidotransferase [Deltaproteobacteria bacterium]